MDVEVSIRSDGLKAVLDAVGPDGRRELNAAAAYSLKASVQRHVRDVAMRRHASASALGAQPTGHMEKGAAAITSGSDGDSAYVSIPIPGFARVFGPVDIRPRSAKALTIPINAISYGRRAGEMRKLGFTLFTFSRREGGENGVLYGYRDGEDSITPLYALKKHTRLSQDRTLLPSDDDMSRAAEAGMLARISAARRSA